MVHSLCNLGTGEVGVQVSHPCPGLGTSLQIFPWEHVPAADSAEKFLTTPRIQGAVILCSIQQDSGELDPLQYGILAARGGVLGNVHACSRLNSGSLILPVRIHTVPD